MRARLFLTYRPPFEWGALLDYLGARATPGVEAVSRDRTGWYSRTVSLQGHRGYLTATLAQERSAVSVTVSPGLSPVTEGLGVRLRRLFDLDAHPRAIAAHLSTDRRLAPLVARRRGLRAPGAFDGFELAVRAVLGQQISVRGATTLAGRLAARVGETATPSEVMLPALNRFPVTAERLADAHHPSITGLGITRARARCLIALARATAEGEFPELLSGPISNDPMSLVHRLQTLPGIGPWTAMYVAMRGLGWRDAFPDGDLGLRKSMGDMSPARLRLVSERWRPWRAYAAQHLWAGLADRAA